MSEKNIFKLAVEGKFRYPHNGLINTEDLYDLNVTSLDKIYKKLNAEAKALKEDSLLETRTKKDYELDLKIEIIKTIVEEKLEAKRLAKEQFEKAEKKQRILGLIERKQDEALEKLSTEELEKLAAEL